jgi:hypothetical protein
MVETVTIAAENTDDTQPTLEQTAKEMGISVDGEQEVPKTEDRPDWLPEKFKSAEDLAQAYSELEKRQSSSAEEEPASTDEAREAVESAGVDFDALSSEYAENGELSDKAYDNLEKAGIPRNIVNSYIEAQAAQVEVAQAKVYETVGGQEAYSSMVAWAGENLSEAEVDAYNDAVNSNQMASVDLAVNGLKARYVASEGAEPARQVQGGISGNLGGTYRSMAELMTDMNSPSYKSDPAFRADVEKRLGNSNILESRRG